jgi:hypothetical protein
VGLEGIGKPVCGLASDLQSRPLFAVLWLLHVGGLSGWVRIGFQRGRKTPFCSSWRQP